MEIDKEDPIDFGMVLINERDAFAISSHNVLDMLKDHQDPETREIILAAALAKTLTENMILLIQRLQYATGQ